MTRSLKSALLALAMLVTAAAALAQTAPVVDVEFKETSTVPGQFLTLRITVLVPTWMPQPVVFPPLDAPNVRVRLPDRSTSPTSRRIDGAEWSGVTRRYMVSPMAPGRFALPEDRVTVTYADPDNPSEPVRTTVALPALQVEGLVPPGAEGLSPFIAAAGLELEQNLSDTTTGLTPGDSLKRTVTATISGTSPMMLPQLMASPKIEGFAVYADEPVLEEKEDRGLLTGTRREVVTLMAEGNGGGELPAVEISWYNLKTKTVETASLEPVPVSATGPPASATDLLSDLNARVLLMAGVSIAVLALLLWWCVPALLRILRARKEHHRAGKAFARKTVLKAIAAHDYSATVAALQVWAERPPETTQADRQAIRAALVPISARRYGGATDEGEARDWQTLAEALRRANGHRPASSPSRSAHLPALNP
jgi:hypothetical protein